MLRRYGLSYFWFQKAPTLLLEKFKGIYSLQSQGQAFRSPAELLKKVDLFNLTQETMRSAIKVIPPPSPYTEGTKRVHVLLTLEGVSQHLFASDEYEQLPNLFGVFSPQSPITIL
jgi:hypothetical protein